MSKEINIGDWVRYNAGIEERDYLVINEYSNGYKLFDTLRDYDMFVNLEQAENILETKEKN